MMTKVLFVNERKSGAKSLHESASSFRDNHLHLKTFGDKLIFYV